MGVVMRHTPTAHASSTVTAHRGPRARFFTPHEADVIKEATARLVPGPNDDPAEVGHPGAREADILGYLDGMLSALDSRPETIFRSGPVSARHGTVNGMAQPTELSDAQRIAWTRRLTRWQEAYRAGVVLLDTVAGGDFTVASTTTQDATLASDECATFTDLLFEHTLEGMYAAPEYGGNRDLTGWSEIGFRGDVQPRGYADDEVQRNDGHDQIQPTGVVADLVEWLNDALQNCVLPDPRTERQP